MLVPNRKQNTRLFQFAGSARFAYNWALNEEQKNYEAGGKFFRGLAEHPKYKSRKHSKPGFYADPVKLKVRGTHVKLENIAQSKRHSRRRANWFRLAEHNRIPVNAKYFSPRVSFDGLHWFLTVGIEAEAPEPVPGTNGGIGIDAGIKDLAVCSSGQVFRNINKTRRVRRLKKKLRRLQRRLSRKYDKNKKGGSYQKTRNIAKSERELLRLNRRLTNIRTNHIHQASAEIVRRKPSFIVMEDLNVSGMMKNKHLARAVQEQKLAEFHRIMRYKCDWHGIRFITADRFYPSSKLCSVCGHKKADLKLSDRTYRCEHCGTVIDRDMNASINLYHYGKSVPVR